MAYYMYIHVLSILCTMLGSKVSYGQFITPGNFCYPGFTQHGATCYRYINLQTSWVDALAYCSLMGAHLVTVETAGENMILTEIIKNATRGYNETMVERTWTSGTNLQGRLQWQNFRIPITYTAWASGEPHLTSHDAVYCVMKFRDTWYADDCNHARRFICEAKINGLVVPIVDGQKPTSSPEKPDIAIG